MNDLDLIRSMRAEAPEPPQDQMTAGRDHLLAAIAGQQQTRPTVFRWRRSWPAAWPSPPARQPA